MNRSVLLVLSLILNAVLVTILVVRRPVAPVAEPAPVAEAPSASAPVEPAPNPEPAAAPAAPARPRVARNAPAPAPAPEPAPPEPAPAAVDTGSLRIDSDVPGAQVFIDRRFVGVAPLTVDLKFGSHQLNASVEGFEGIANPVEVGAGTQQVTIRFREVKLDARADVVHKHRIGSCKGQLVATAQGLRYETSDKDDAFNVPLLDLDQFEVNYLEKNLRIRLKKGKTYNFTDPDGKADRLFVLHRDVEKAREKLKAGGVPAGD